MEDEIEILVNKYDNGEIVSKNCELESIYVGSQNDKYEGNTKLLIMWMGVRKTTRINARLNDSRGYLYLSKKFF